MKVLPNTIVHSLPKEATYLRHIQEGSSQYNTEDSRHIAVVPHSIAHNSWWAYGLRERQPDGDFARFKPPIVFPALTEILAIVAHMVDEDHRQ